MKKSIKFIALCAVMLTAFNAFAAKKTKASKTESSDAKVEAAADADSAKPAEDKKAKKEKAKKEKPAKEKPAKAPKQEKAKPVKKVKFDQAAYDAAFEKGDYETCAGMLLGKDDKKNAVRDLLDADMLMYLAANYQESGKAFLETYGKMQQASAELSAGKAVGAAMGGENAIKYSGAEYERYLAWSMRLVNALNTNQTDVANGIMKDYVGTFMAEIQELRAKNAEMEAEAEKALEDDEFKGAQDKLTSSGVKMSFSEYEKPKKTDAKYESSPFFNYLGTVAYAVSGDVDHAEEFGTVYKVSKVKDITKIPDGKGRLEVVALSGMIGRRGDFSEGKEAAVAYLPLPNLNMQIPLYTKVSYPVFDPAAQNHLIKGVRVSLSDGSTANAEIVEDFDNAVKVDVDRKAPGAYSRSVYRNVVKNSIVVASVVAAGIALDQAKSASALAAVAAQVVFDKAVDAAANAVANKERADIRQGYYFPNLASAAGFNVAPGTYTVTVEYLDSYGKVVESKTIENVAVEQGKVTARISSCEK